LRLPKTALNAKKGDRRKKEIKLMPHQMIEKIDLSGFQFKRFSRAGMKELIEGM
jgi:hypothetical protein